MSVQLQGPAFSVACVIKNSAADAANSNYFALSNPAASTKTIVLKKFLATMSFDGTGSATVSCSWVLIKNLLQGNPTTGTGLTPVPLTDSAVASILTATNVMFKATPLTITITTALGNMWIGSISASLTDSVNAVDLDWSTLSAKGVKLKPGEGVVLQNPIGTTIGQAIGMTLIWEEVPII